MEAQIIQAAAGGDETAFQYLVHHYSPRIYRMAYRYVRNREEAQDVTQDTFLKAYVNIARFDCNRPLYPWLKQICRNTALNRLAKKDSRTGSLEEPDIIRGKGGEPEVLYIDHENKTELLTAMTELPQKQQRILELKHFEECSYQEIADELQIPIGTVMSRLYTARKNLAAILTSDKPQHLSTKGVQHE
ncbi:RNA polymerase sigma factor [Spirochaeta dissipatitropha]